MRRRIVILILSIGILLGACQLYKRLAPCKACEAEDFMASHLGVEPNLVAIGKYLDQEITVGASKEHVFALLDKIKPDSVAITHDLADEHDVPNAVCYHVRFDNMLDGYLVLNRYLCFDGNDVLFYTVHDLALN